MLNLNLYKKYFLGMFFSFICMLTINPHTFAQVEWSLDASMGNNLSSAVYIPGMESVLFIRGTELLFYPLNGTEQVAGDIRNYGNLPSGWTEITAAVLWSSSTVLLFNGENYVSLNINDATLSGAKRFPGLPKNWNGRLDAAVNWNGDLYFFAGGQYAKYAKKQKSFIEYEMMRKWNGWADIWSEGAQSVLNIGDGYLYFFNDGECLVFNALNNSFQSPPFRIADELPPGEEIVEFEEEPPGLDIMTNKGNDAPPTALNNGSNTNNWCLTGVPSGNSNAGLSADVIYMKNGDSGNEMIDDAVAGARLAEIRVWGNFVIYGLQTILETPEGQLIELPILGKEKGKASSFKLAPDECLTGIEGTHIGADGRYIHTIRFQTSSGKSPIFGTRKGHKTFNVKIPDGTAFYGLAVKSKSFLTSVGIKFVYFDDANLVAHEGTISSANNGMDESSSGGGPEDTPRDEWRDDYEDFTKELIELSWGSATAVRQLPASDWLGTGVNILTLDPVDIAKSETKTPPIELTVSEKLGGPRADKALPMGSDYKTELYAKDDKVGKWIEKHSDFTKQYGGSVGVSGGFGPVAGSLSASFSEMNNTKIGSKEIHLTRFVESRQFWVRLKLNWRQQGFGKARQKLNLDFRSMVEHLPVPRNIPDKTYSSMTKGAPLPYSVESVRQQYQALLDEYGTHFVRKAFFGGKYVSNTIITKQDYEATRQNKNAFKALVQGQAGPVSLGANVAFSYGEKSTVGEKSKTLNVKKFVQGGGAVTTFDKWEAGLLESPSVIKVELMGTYELLTNIFFPNDPDIDKKRKVLKMVMEQYVKDNGQLPQEPDSEFFTEPKPSSYNVAISRVYIKKGKGSENRLYGGILKLGVYDGFGQSKNDLLFMNLNGHKWLSYAQWKHNCFEAKETDEITRFNRSFNITLTPEELANTFVTVTGKMTQTWQWGTDTGQHSMGDKKPFETLEGEKISLNDIELGVTKQNKVTYTDSKDGDIVEIHFTVKRNN